MQRLCSLIFASSLLACAESLPEPPDLSDRLEAYQEGPTVDIPLGEVADTILSVLNLPAFADLLPRSGIIVEQVAEGIGLRDPDREGIDPIENPREAVQILEGKFLIDLYLELAHTCEGHDPEVTTPDADKNGTLDVNFRVTESGFEGTFWGEFSRCRFRSDDVDLGLPFNAITINGDAAVLFLDPAGFDVDRDYLFVFEGLAIVNDVLFLNGPFDMVFRQDLGAEVRIPDGIGGNVFIFVPADNPNAIQLRTLTETWECDLEQQRCLSDDGTQVSW